MEPDLISLVSNRRYDGSVKRSFGLASMAMGGIVVLALPAQTPPSSTDILADAEARAQAGRRAIFVIFDASW